MPFHFFLAQTAAEFHQKLPQHANKAWMACHFSSYSTGLTNLPSGLPDGSMVIVNDRIPVCGHDPALIAAQLAQLVKEAPISHVLLDFQRPGEAQTQAIAKAIVKALDCPVGVSQAYAKGLDCPVFLPPPPLHLPLHEHTRPWQGRPVWLELMPDCAAYTITENGCSKSACPGTGVFPHFDEAAVCRYRIEMADNAIRFTLRRDIADLARLEEAAQIDCFIGLYQDFAQPEAQATALDQ